MSACGNIDTRRLFAILAVALFLSPVAVSAKDPQTAVGGATPSALASDTTQGRNLADSSLFSAYAPSVAYIAGKKGDGVASGTGSIISEDGLILTNWHVVNGMESIKVYLYSKHYLTQDDVPAIPARLVKVDQVADLALIRMLKPPAGLRPLRLGQIGDVQVGMDVHAIGHPRGQLWSYTKGLVSHVRAGYQWRDAHAATVIQSQTPISPGNSGGPLLNDEGHIVGVNTFYLPDSALLSYSVGVDEIRKFLARAEHRYLPGNAPQAARAHTSEGITK